MDLFLDEFIANERLDGSFRGLVSEAYSQLRNEFFLGKQKKEGLCGGD